MSTNNTLHNDELLDEASSGCTNTSCCPPKTPSVRVSPKIGRNDPCICGNGRKYKKCCGQGK